MLWEKIDRYIFTIRSKIPSITENEILWEHDIGWIRDMIDLIEEERGQQRRDALLDMRAVMIAVMAEGAQGVFTDQLQSTLTKKQWEVKEKMDKIANEYERSVREKELQERFAQKMGGQLPQPSGIE